MNAPDWITWTQALGTTLAAVVSATAAAVAVWVGFRQASISREQAEIARRQEQSAQLQSEVAKEKLKLELFDRRNRIFEAAREVVVEVVREAKLEQGSYIRYRVAIQGATWLFSDEVCELLEKKFGQLLADLMKTTTMRLDGARADISEVNRRHYELVEQIPKYFDETVTRALVPFMRIQIA